MYFIAVDAAVASAAAAAACQKRPVMPSCFAREQTSSHSGSAGSDSYSIWKY